MQKYEENMKEIWRNMKVYEENMKKRSYVPSTGGGGDDTQILGWLPLSIQGDPRNFSKFF